MKISKEQAERLCAYFASKTPDESINVLISDITWDTEHYWSPGGVQEAIREYVTSPENI